MSVPEQSNSNIMSQRYRLCDLFCGVGGISRAFELTKRAELVYANDVEPKCKETYDLNHKVPLTVKDITKVKATDIPDHDILLGGFPCQSFSVSGNRKGFKDKRGNLFFEIVRILRHHRPRFVLLENVKNLESHDKGKTLKVILKELKALNYIVRYKVLNACVHGNLPQNRERIFLCCFQREDDAKQFEFPDPIPLTTGFRDILEDTDDVDDCHFYETKGIYDKIKDDITSEETVYQYRRYYVRENKSGVCPTLTANMGTGGHNVPLILDSGRIRRLTPRECFSLQGFPKEFKLGKLANSHLYKQAGNSVPVKVIERIAMKIVAILDKNSDQGTDISSDEISGSESESDSESDSDSSSEDSESDSEEDESLESDESESEEESS